MGLRRAFSVIAFAAALSGCAAADHFSDRVSSYDYAASQSRDTMVFNNILRASRGEPLSFVQLGQITGQTGTAGVLGLPPIVLGPKAPNVSALKDTVFGASAQGGQGFVGNQLSMTGSTSFSASPTENKEFYLGLLREVEPRTLKLFVEQGVAREVLFYLFTDRLIETRGGLKRELRNDPLAPDFDQFRTYVKLAQDYGLSSERVSGGEEIWPPKADKPVKKQERWRLCFDKLYWNKSAPWANNTPVCGSGGSGGDGRTVSFNSQSGERMTLQVLPRSTYAIFQYLGRVVAAGERGKVNLVSAEAIDQPPFEDPVLFDVRAGSSEDCFVAASVDGEGYCVPRQGAVNSKRVLGLLVQLIALNTAIADVPVTPTVRVVQ